MGSNNYVPTNDSQFLDWGKTILQHAIENHTRWGLLNPEPVLAPVLEDFETKLSMTTGSNAGRVDLSAKRLARKDAERALRNFIQGFLARNQNVDELDRITMKIPIRDTTPTNVPPPSIPATGRLTFPAIGLVEICDIQTAGERSDRRSKYGVRIYYGVIAEQADASRYRIAAPPKTGDDLPFSVFTRLKRYRFDFTGNSGREAFFCMRYENAKGQAGPWGKIISAYVP